MNTWNHVKLYFKGAFVAMAVFIVVGLVAPMLISADDDVSPFIGVIVLLCVPPVVWTVYRHLYIQIKEEHHAEKETVSRARTTRAR